MKNFPIGYLIGIFSALILKTVFKNIWKWLAKVIVPVALFVWVRIKPVVDYIWDFLKTEFHAGIYLSVLLFLGVTVHLNYVFGWEDWLEQKFLYTETRFLVYFVLFALPYYFVVLVVWLFKRTNVFNNPKFWWRSAIAIAIMSLDKCFYYHNELFYMAHYDIKHFVYRVSGNLRSILTVLIPLLLIYFITEDGKSKNFYGLHKGGFDIKPYLVMLAIMIPILYWASTTPDFTSYYPKYRNVRGARAAEYLGIPEWGVATSFEVAYSWDFIMVELLLRGFLVVGLIKVIGKEAVLPMAAAYCYYHFGKPEMETISSFFGGYILGILAYRTKSIWGGVFIHVAIALLMELFAYIQNLIKLQ